MTGLLGSNVVLFSSLFLGWAHFYATQNVSNSSDLAERLPLSLGFEPCDGLSSLLSGPGDGVAAEEEEVEDYE